MGGRGGWTRPVALALALVLGAGTVAAAATRLPSDARLDAPAAQVGEPVADLASELLYDVEAIFRFVADEIAYEPYAGILRGAESTLAARAGNSVDKALLLAGLLDASLIRYRFATGPLDEAAAANLVASTVVDAAAARALADRVLIGPTAGPAAATGTGPTAAPAAPEVEAFAATLAADGARVADVAGEQLDRSVAAIDGAIDAAGMALPETEPSLPAMERDAHTWVQIASGTDWLDLDPTVPGAGVGAAAANASQTLDALPDDLRHRVTIASILETVSGSGVRSDTILEYEGFADAIAGLPITFAHLKPDGMEAMGLTIGRVLGEAETSYDALLAVGDATVVGTTPVAFGTTGRDLFGEEVESTGPGSGEAIAEWLEVRVTGPDGTTDTSRRTLFDRLDPAARAAAEADASSVDLATVEPVELVDLDDATLDEYPPMRAVHAFVVATGPDHVSSLLELPFGTENVGLLGSVGRAYHWLRDGLGAEVATPRGVRTFVRGPNVVSWSFGVDAAPDTEPVTTLELDLWHRDLGTLPVADTPATAHPSVVAGVLSHVAERIAMRDGFERLDDETVPSVGVGTITDAALDQGIALRVLGPGDVATTGLGADADARLVATLAAGDLAIIPERPVVIDGRDHIGWWRVDPETGETVDEMPDGSGSQGTEYQIPLNTSFRVGMCLLALSEKIVGLLAIAAKALGYDSTALGLGAVAIGLWTANFFNPGWAKVCRGS